VRVLRRHWLFIVVAIPALLLRVDAELGYRWQSWFNDSFSYVRAAVLLQPETQRVSGYPVMLWLLSPFHSLALITILQHLIGLGIGFLVYWLARDRFGARAWVAVLAAIPVLYDAFQVQLEHLVMPDIWYMALIVSAVAVLASGGAIPPRPPLRTGGSPPPVPPGPTWRRAALAGVALGVADIVRSAALPLVAVFVVCLLIIVTGGWLAKARVVVALLVACAVPVLAYASWFDDNYGQFAMTDSTGVFLYSRVITFAQCDKMGTLSPQLRALCVDTPPSDRAPGEEYIWRSYSPLVKMSANPFNPTTNKLAEKFAIRAIESQPLDYARAVLDDTWKAFGWSRTPFPDAPTYDEYLFGYSSVPVPTYSTASIYGYHSYEAYFVRGDPTTQVVNPWAAIIRGYQRYVWLPGTVYGLLLLFGLFGIAATWRVRGRYALLPWGVSLAMIVVPAATASFDYRYVLPAVPLACLAAAMVAGPVVGRFRRSAGAATETGDNQRDLTPDTA
jgi:hypothetical protein